MSIDVDKRFSLIGNELVYQLLWFNAQAGMAPVPLLLLVIVLSAGAGRELPFRRHTIIDGRTGVFQLGNATLDISFRAFESSYRFRLLRAIDEDRATAAASLSDTGERRLLLRRADGRSEPIALHLGN